MKDIVKSNMKRVQQLRYKKHYSPAIYNYYFSSTSDNITLKQTEIIVYNNKTTIGLAIELANDNRRVLAHNYASWRKPGGGCWHSNNITAQEENNCYRSDLYWYLEKVQSYQTESYKIGSKFAVYCKNVDILLDDNYNKVHKTVDFISMSAPDLRGYNGDMEFIYSLFRSSFKLMFDLAVEYDITDIISGKWGCGVYKNDYTYVKQIMIEEYDKYGRGKVNLHLLE